jgi:group I intron endonuclease
VELVSANGETFECIEVTSVHKTSGIYALYNMDNKKMYVGKSVNVYERIQDHNCALNNNKHTNSYLQNSFNKYKFIYVTIEKCEENLLNEREIYYIKHLDTFANSRFGYNFTLGGDGVSGMVVTDDTRRRISEDLTGIKRSDGFKQKLSNRGKILGIPDNTRNKSVEVCSIPIVQVTFNGEIKYWDSASIASKELVLSSTCIRQCCTNKIKFFNNSFWFNKEDYESSDFIMPTQTKTGYPIVQLNLDGSFVSFWNHATEACKSNANLYDSAIGACCKGKRKKHGGYIWIYQKDYPTKYNNNLNNERMVI